jgi:hypothetical protein
MNTKHFATLAVLSAATVCSTSYADVGWMDGDTTYNRFGLTGSSVEVPLEQAQPRETGNIGPRGVSGSRYSARTREEVIDDLKEHQRTHPNPLRPGDIYFGG